MFIKSKVTVLILGFVFFGCKLKESPEFYYTSNNLKYKFHDVSIADSHPQIGDYLVINLLVRNLSDSICYSSSSIYHSFLDVFLLDSACEKSSICEGFLNLYKGDSVSFYVDGATFCAEYLKEDSLCSFKNMSDLVMTLRLENVIESEKKLLSSFLLEEDIFINKTIEFWKKEYDTVHNYGLLNWVYLNDFSGESVQVNDEVQVSYSCILPSGEVIYSTDSSSLDQFVVGVEGQLIEGYDYLLQHLNYGDHVIALIPSFLAFKDVGGVNGKIPPNTPVIFDVEVVRKIN